MSTSNVPSKIACPHCQALIKAPALAPGSAVTCPKCGQAFRLANPAARERTGGQVSGQAFTPPPPVASPTSSEADRASSTASHRPAAAGAGSAKPAFLTKPPSASAPPPPPPPQERPRPKLSNWVDPKVPPLKPAAAATPKPLPPLPPIDEAELVSLDVTASAAAATQPAHRPATKGQESGNRSQGAGNRSPAASPSRSARTPSLDGIVDPNLLPPPPPRPKPKVTQVPVVCRLCSTRLYAPIEHVGQLIRCPDCHSVNEIKLPPELARQSQPKPPPPPPIPELEPTPSSEPAQREDDRGHKGIPADVWQAHQPASPPVTPATAAVAAHAADDELALSETVERPTYRPLVEPRGEYAVLKAMDPEARAAGWSDPGAEPAPVEHAKKPSPAQAVVPAAKTVVALEPEPHEVEEEFTISAPVERIEIKPEPVKLPKFDPDESLYDGRYDDDLFGEVDPRQPQSWKRSPFLLGVVGFLFLPNTITRWLLFSLGLALAAMFFNTATHYALTPDKPTEQVYAIFFAIAFSVTFGFWLAPFCTALLGVIQDTANGSNDVENWPDWNIVEWFYPMVFVPFAALLSGLPGMFFTSMLLGTGLDPRIGMAAAAVPLMLSWIVLFPLVMYSMLAEGSVLSPFSPHTLRSLKVASDGWIVFYMASILLSLVGTAAGSFMMSRYLILGVLGAWGTVTCMLLYARLLGRLMWYSAQKEAKLEAEERQAS